MAKSAKNRIAYKRAYYLAHKDEISARYNTNRDSRLIYSRAYYLVNKDKSKVYSQANKEKIKARARMRYLSNKEKLREEYIVNKEENLEYGKNYYIANKEKRRAYNNAYREKHRDEIRKRNKECRLRNKSLIAKRARKSRLMSYGITEQEYGILLLKQKGVCAICGNAETKTLHGVKNPLSVDHCHNTNQVRGLLCGKCNTAIGLLNDDIAMLSKAIAYLANTTKIDNKVKLCG
jgi:hypothetical protein